MLLRSNSPRTHFHEMGACFGLFKKRTKPKKLLSVHRCFYFYDSDRVEIELLVNDEPEDNMDEESICADIWPASLSKLAVISADDFKTKSRRSGRTGKWTKSTNNLVPSDSTSENQELLALDAHTLLASRALQKRAASCSSTPPSSIDLEWENESLLHGASVYLRSLQSLNADEGGSSCSGGGGDSAESLEWDPCNPNSVDLETEQLINEIEQLARRALNETGHWTDKNS